MSFKDISIPLMTFFSTFEPNQLCNFGRGADMYEKHVCNIEFGSVVPPEMFKDSSI